MPTAKIRMRLAKKPKAIGQSLHGLASSSRTLEGQCLHYGSSPEQHERDLWQHHPGLPPVKEGIFYDSIIIIP